MLFKKQQKAILKDQQRATNKIELLANETLKNKWIVV